MKAVNDLKLRINARLFYMTLNLTQWSLFLFCNVKIDSCLNTMKTRG